MPVLNLPFCLISQNIRHAIYFGNKQSIHDLSQLVKLNTVVDSPRLN